VLPFATDWPDLSLSTCHQLIGWLSASFTALSFTFPIAMLFVAAAYRQG